MGISPACMYVRPCVPGAHGGQKKASDPLGLESQTVVSCPVDAGTSTWIPWESSRFSILSIPL